MNLLTFKYNTMRFFNLFILNIILCLSLGFSSCISEQENEFEESNGNTASKSARSVGYVPSWWDDVSQLEIPYNY